MARQQAEEAARREAEQREAEAAALRAREEMLRELRKLQQSFALRLEGSATIGPPQKVALSHVCTRLASWGSIVGVILLMRVAPLAGSADKGALPQGRCSYSASLLQLSHRRQRRSPDRGVRFAGRCP